MILAYLNKRGDCFAGARHDTGEKVNASGEDLRGGEAVEGLSNSLLSESFW
jgi:hypothetical protein